MELKQGNITWKDLSIWFGLKPDSLSKHPKTKTKKLEVLKGFADYHFEGKKLIIDKVKIPTYSKAYDFIEAHYLDEWGKIIDKETCQLDKVCQNEKIDTCARVGDTLYYKYNEVKSQIERKTARSYTNMAKRKDWGRNYIKGDKGEKGTSCYVWVNQEGHPLNADELRIVKECSCKAYGVIDDKIALYDSAYREGQMTKAERDEAIAGIDTEECYDDFVDIVIEELGYFPEKRTKLESFEGAWSQWH